MLLGESMWFFLEAFRERAEPSFGDPDRMRSGGMLILPACLHSLLLRAAMVLLLALELSLKNIRTQPLKLSNMD